MNIDKSLYEKVRFWAKPTFYYKSDRVRPHHSSYRTKGSLSYMTPGMASAACPVRNRNQEISETKFLLIVAVGARFARRPQNNQHIASFVDMYILLRSK